MKKVVARDIKTIARSEGLNVRSLKKKYYALSHFQRRHAKIRLATEARLIREKENENLQ